VKAFAIKIQRSGIWWAFDAAVFLVRASYAIRHFTNVVELICNSQPFFRHRDCHIYFGCSIFQMALPGTCAVLCIVFFPTRKEYPKDTNDSSVARYLKQVFLFRLPEM